MVAGDAAGRHGSPSDVPGIRRPIRPKQDEAPGRGPRGVQILLPRLECERLFALRMRRSVSHLVAMFCDRSLGLSIGLHSPAGFGGSGATIRSNLLSEDELLSSNPVATFATSSA